MTRYDSRQAVENNNAQLRECRAGRPLCLQAYFVTPTRFSQRKFALTKVTNFLKKANRQDAKRIVYCTTKREANYNAGYSLMNTNVFMNVSEIHTVSIIAIIDNHHRQAAVPVSHVRLQPARVLFHRARAITALSALIRRAGRGRAQAPAGDSRAGHRHKTVNAFEAGHQAISS